MSYLKPRSINTLTPTGVYTLAEKSLDVQNISKGLQFFSAKTICSFNLLRKVPFSYFLIRKILKMINSLEKNPGLGHIQLVSWAQTKL